MHVGILEVQINVCYISTLQSLKIKWRFQSGKGRDWESPVFLQIIDYH